MATCVFSTLYNETAEFLPAYIDNFLAFTGPEHVLVVNLSIPAQARIDLRGKVGERVHIISGAEPRRIGGHSLLGGHLQNYRYAETLPGGFDYFCAMASNSLFVKQFDMPAVQAALTRVKRGPGFAVNEMPSEWWWPKVAGSADVMTYLTGQHSVTHVTMSQIEGLLAGREAWGLVAAEAVTLAGISRGMEPGSLFPFEEVFPATLMSHYAAGAYTQISKVYFNDDPTKRFASMADVLFAGRDLPEHVCSMKWFVRDTASPVTAAVCTPAGRAMVAGIAGELDAEGRVPLRRALMLQQIERVVMASVSAAPFTGALWAEEVEPIGARWTGPCQRGVVAMLGKTGHGEGTDLAYLYLENTGARLNVALEVTPAEGLVRLTCRAPEAPADGTFEAVAYLRCAVKPGSGLILRLRFTPEAGNRGEIDRIVWRFGAGRYEWLQPALAHAEDGRRVLYFQIPAERMPQDAATPVFFGLPLSRGTALRVHADMEYT